MLFSVGEAGYREHDGDVEQWTSLSLVLFSVGETGYREHDRDLEQWTSLSLCVVFCR